MVNHFQYHDITWNSLSYHVAKSLVVQGDAYIGRNMNVDVFIGHNTGINATN